ncbi:hypothetical protein PR202_gb26733 [Eleusine coracana subsp. coracana]|uniref:Uncharacterized protein n=1 Tax=Eleusine coracana subsp. coracana TaxID=191504 RepID=A0AAV5FSK1_ELECO|nr:hypothetical protein PR202_gb26733 [Eleusine coracana subsp. coracana]
MALLCFLLDLRNIPPPLLHRLKQAAELQTSLTNPVLRRGVARGRARANLQCLLHLANLYAATTSPSHPVSAAAAAPTLPDRLALVYVHHAASSDSSSSSSSSSSSPELKIGYRPGENFSLRDFHQAVNNVPLDGFLPEQRGRSLHTGDVSLANLFSNRAIYSWATDDISKKVIAICMSVQNIEALRRSLMDAAEQCVAVDFVMLETEASLMYDGMSENVNCLENKICDLENCVVRRYSPESQVLHGLVKRWLEELKDDKEETLQAVLVFREPIINSVKHIYCNLYASTNQIIDAFPYCQVIKIHLLEVDLNVVFLLIDLFYSVTCKHLRLAGSEEILPLPGANRDCNSTVTDEIKISIGTSLSKIVLKDYNPLEHERGFHSKLICLVKDSLQFGYLFSCYLYGFRMLAYISIDPACALSNHHPVDSFSEPQVSACQGPLENKFLTEAAEKVGGLNDHIYSFSEPQTSSFRTPKEKKALSQSKNRKASPSISEEWEKLIIIDDLTDDFATPAAPRPAAAKPQRAKPPSPVKQLDEKTSRILERLEAPKAKKPRANTGKASTSAMPMPAPSRVARTQTKKPLLPSQPCASQQLKPTFNKLRRKLPT